MGLFGRVVNSMRASIGLDTVADSLDRKIDKVGAKEERNLKSSKILNDSHLRANQYQMSFSKDMIQILDRILNYIERINELALLDVKKVDSGMMEDLGFFKGNYDSLNVYLDAMKKNIAIPLYIQYHNAVENSLEAMKKRYITSVLRSQTQDNGVSAKNDEITYHYQILQMEVNSLSYLNSSFSYYEWLEDIYNQVTLLKSQALQNLHQMEINNRPFVQTDASIQYQLGTIARQREALKHTKAYLDANKDRGIKRG